MRCRTTTAATKKAAVTTADWLIYAIGGGHGHARRGWLLQRRLAEMGRSAVLLVRPGSDRYLPDSDLPRRHGDSLADPRLLDLLARPTRGIVVDAFPGGWRNEITPSALLRFERRIWLARYSRTHGPADGAAYHQVTAPYPADRCEWEGGFPGIDHTGYLVDAGHLDLGPDARSFLVVDSASRCNPRILTLFADTARRCGLSFQLRRQLHGSIRARKLLVVGAGYHSFYECLGQPVDVRFLPVHKRHDDQFRRARMFGREVTSPEQLLCWLGDDSPPDRGVPSAGAHGRQAGCDW